MRIHSHAYIYAHILSCVHMHAYIYPRAYAQTFKLLRCFDYTPGRVNL